MSKGKLSLYTEKQIEAIKNDYYQGFSIAELCDRNNITPNQFTGIRRTLKLSRPLQRHPNVKQAVQEHINGALLKDVCEKYSISDATIYKYMKQHSIVYRNGHGRKYHCNESFFHTIDTEEKAYWLGFILGDGCVAYSDKSCSSPNRLTLNLSQRDRCQLENFNQAIESNFLITDYIPKGSYSDHPMSRLCINSIEMCKDLISHGCVSNKTRKLSFPYSSTPDNLYCHCIRGIFDADGSISEGYSPTFSITKYIPFLLQLQDILESEGIAIDGKIYTYKDRAESIGDLRYYGKTNVYNIAVYMYSQAHIFLQRKCDKAASILID